MTSDSLSVLVLAGGISHERDVSLRSGRRVADALLERGWKVTVREPDSRLLGSLRDGGWDVVWPALHGASGGGGAPLPPRPRGRSALGGRAQRRPPPARGEPGAEDPVATGTG